MPSGPHEGWTSWALSHVSGGGGPPCSGSQFPSLVSGQGRALARPRPLGRVWTQMAAPAKGSRALPGCWPETLQEGTGPGLRPGKATRGSCVTVGASGYSPHPRCGPSGQAPRALGVPGSGQCWGGGRGTATCWPGRELVTQARPFPPGMKSPGCSCESTDRQMGAVWPEPHRPIHLLPSAGRNRRTQLYKDRPWPRAGSRRWSNSVPGQMRPGDRCVRGGGGCSRLISGATGAPRMGRRC